MIPGIIRCCLYAPSCLSLASWSILAACEYSGTDLNSSQCFSPATGGVWKGTLIFGGAQLLVSQVRNLEEAWWVSVLGTLGSLIYSFIALILGMVHAGNGLGSVGGNDGSSSADKAFQVLNALGSIAFAYNFSLILPEIQRFVFDLPYLLFVPLPNVVCLTWTHAPPCPCSTLRQPPSAVRTMSKVSGISITGSYIFYILIAIGGYAALGSNVQPIILDSYVVSTFVAGVVVAGDESISLDVPTLSPSHSFNYRVQILWTKLGNSSGTDCHSHPHAQCVSSLRAGSFQHRRVARQVLVAQQGSQASNA